MLPSFLSTLIWGHKDQGASPGDKETVQHVTVEGEEGWLLVNQSRESAGSSSDNGREWDMDSMCSDGSWVLTPSAPFSDTQPPSAVHPMEDLLIEHPTMSVYVQPTTHPDVKDETQNNELEQLRQERQAMVVLRNRRRREVARHLQPSVLTEVRTPNGDRQQLRLTRRALKRQNLNTFKGAKPVKKLPRKPGKRRC